MVPHPEVYPKRVVWVQEEDTGKWVLVGLSTDGEVQDPKNYEDVRVPLPDQPTGRVWVRDENTGKWGSELAQASREELAQADAAVRRAAYLQQQQQQQHQRRPRQDPSENVGYIPSRLRGVRKSPRQGGASSGMMLSTIHQKYATRLAGGQRLNATHDAIREECDQDEGECEEDEPGVKYHIVRPSDTFQFICLKYKVSADALRGANNFTGSTLKNAPTKLIIPSKGGNNNNREQKREEKKEDDPIAPRRRRTPSEAKAEAKNTSATANAPVTTAIKKKPSVEFDSSTNINPKPKISREEDEVQYHWVEPDDSLRWICLKYKVNANDLRRANNFTGSNLKLAPRKLIIPKPASKSPKKTPRLRRPKSEGSAASRGSAGERRTRQSDNASCPQTRASKEEETLASSFTSGLTMTENNEDFNSSMGNLHSIASHSGIISTGLDELEAFEGTENTSHHHNLSEHVYGEGDEGENEFIAPAPMEMVHLNAGQKFSGHMGGPDSDSDIGDTDDEELIGMESNGVRYHDVRPSDTIEYLCLKYRVSAPALRRANIGLTGRNLQTGPKRLIIPPNSSHSQGNQGFGKKDTNATQDTESVTTHDDETNTLALSDGHSTLADQNAALEMLGEAEDKALYHDVQPNDTLQGVCLLYGVSAYELRRANNFRGLNLSSAPDRLLIPRNGRNQSKNFKSLTEDEKIQSLLAHVPISRQTKKPLLSHDEARAYLEFNEWNFDQALRNVKVDVEWSSERSRVPRVPLKSRLR